MRPSHARMGIHDIKPFLPGTIMAKSCARVLPTSQIQRVVTHLQVWLKQPLVDLTEINTRHDIVETFTSDPTLRESLRDQHLRGHHPVLWSASPVLLQTTYGHCFTAAVQVNEMLLQLLFMCKIQVQSSIKLLLFGH